MRLRTFLIALPIALGVALCVGPGLSEDDAPQPAEEQPAAPATDPTEHEALPHAGAGEMQGVECTPIEDPGPDGDK